MPPQHRKTKSFGIYDESWEPKVAKEIQERVLDLQLQKATSGLSIDEAAALPTSALDAAAEELVNEEEKKGKDWSSAVNIATAAAAVAPVGDDGSDFMIGGFAALDDSVSAMNSTAGAAGPASTGIANSDRPFMVALCGIPGSGKAISALVLANLLEGQGIGTMVMPHLGYHFPLEYLKSHFGQEVGDDLIYRRGAPDTFDTAALLRDIQRVRGEYIPPDQSHHSGGRGHNRYPSTINLAPGESETIISIPGFDHAKGDPEPDVHTFDRNHHKVVICEGLYFLHDGDGWEEVKDMFDLTIFLEESDVDTVMERLKIRNQVIPGYTPEEIADRVEKIDRVNANVVMASKDRADLVVQNVTKPIGKEERPTTPDAMSLALSALDLSDFQKTELAAKDHKDWTMDIISRPESNANLHDYTRSRANSVISEQSEPPPPASQFVGTWEKEQAKVILDRLKVWDDTTSTTEGKPYMVAIAATPGSGKSVSSFMLANMLEENGYPTMICPHDGYHYPLDYLRTFPDADDLVYRRGAPDTFDPEALLRDLDRVRNGEEEIIKFPAFDHAKGDPEPDTHIFDRNRHKIVLCEGLYLLHDQDGWESIKSMFDYTIFMNADIDICIERVKIRNQCIPGYTPEEIAIRCEKVDRINALTVLRSKYRADVIVESAAMKK